MFVLVGGWPASGKSTVAAALGPELGLPVLAKDEIKEAMADGLGRPSTVAESQELGRAAVLVALRVALRCPGAVIDSTWFAYTRPLVAALPGPIVEVRCVVPIEVARERYYARAAERHPGHLDLDRTTEELWGSPVLPLGVGPVVEVDTTVPVDIPALAAAIRSHCTNGGSTDGWAAGTPEG
ncbi:AAA family ATPase [Actinocrispum sp. NPDC049592]|uniref:AAA family ATPase n=1 Tax=Actinocrispum sp. NPDC049592 TaxID=3154835 RepID=UPI00342DE58D